MTDLLIHLGTLSLGGGVAVSLLVLAGRVSRNHYSARWRCQAWGILCLLMIFPIPVFCLPTPIQTPSALIHLEIPSDYTVPEYPAPVSGAEQPVLPAGSEQTSGDIDGPADILPALSTAAQSAPQAPQTPVEPVGPAFSVPALLLGLWLAGIAALLAHHWISHLRFCRWVGRWAAPVTDPDMIKTFRRTAARLGLRHPPALLSCPQLPSPMLSGLFRPALLLPQKMPQGDALELTLEHELTHYRRHDVWRKTLALLANAFHWFNPLMWWMVRRVEYDLELACDDAVLQSRGQAGRAVYGRAVLDALEGVAARSPKGM